VCSVRVTTYYPRTIMFSELFYLLSTKFLVAVGHARTVFLLWYSAFALHLN